MNIFLHRDDLRTHDNKALKKASENGKVLPVYIDDPRISERTGRNKKAFREKNLQKLDEFYREKGSGLIYREANTSDQLENLIKEFEVDKIFFNRSYTPVKRRIESEILSFEVEARVFKDRLLVEPVELSKEYGTFSPFYREWKKIEKDRKHGRPNNFAKVDVEKFRPKTKVGIDLPAAGESAAITKWEEFKDERLQSYKDKRDDVGEPESVSRLSMYYGSGVLGLRKVLEDIEELIEQSDDSNYIRNFAKYRNELAWREFFYQVLWHNPETVQNNYRDFENEIKWKNDSQEFEAWKKGMTGVPFVDAGIRDERNRLHA